MHDLPPPIHVLLARAATPNRPFRIDEGLGLEIASRVEPFHFSVSVRPFEEDPTAHTSAVEEGALDLPAQEGGVVKERVGTGKGLALEGHRLESLVVEELFGRDLSARWSCSRCGRPIYARFRMGRS